MTPRDAKDKAEALVAELIAARVELGLDRKEIARRSGLQMTVIGGGELGDSLPRITTLIRWADALGWGVCFTRKAP